MSSESFPVAVDTNSLFMIAWGDLAYRIYCNAANHGFHGTDIVDNVPTKLMLIVSEIAEAMEGHRKPQQSDKIPEFTLMEEELADAVIRIMDLGHMLGLNLGSAIITKEEYNRTRPHMHGGKAY